MLRRAQALVVVLALLATPLALYARGIASDMPNCNGMCCMPQHHHAAQPTPDEQLAQAVAQSAADSECHHHSMSAAKASASPTRASAAASEEPSHSCAFHCAMHSKPHAMTVGLIAPIAPTKPSDLAAIRIATDATRAIDLPNSSAPTGFLTSPFQPPRA